MRKRSGGLHSDSEEEYLQLAQLSQNQNGFFYDDRVHKQYTQVKGWSLGELQEVIDPKFSGFQFNQDDLEEKQQAAELWAQKNCVQINVVLLVQDIEKIKQEFMDLSPANSSLRPDIQNEERQGNRTLDLWMRVIIKNHVTFTYKYWIINELNSSEIMFHSYFKRAKHIFRVVSSEQNHANQTKERDSYFKTNYVKEIADSRPLKEVLELVEKE